MRWLRWLRQRIHCGTHAGTCPFCEAWKKSNVMPGWQTLNVPGRKYPGKSPDRTTGR